MYSKCCFKAEWTRLLLKNKATIILYDMQTKENSQTQKGYIKLTNDEQYRATTLQHLTKQFM